MAREDLAQLRTLILEVDRPVAGWVARPTLHLQRRKKMNRRRLTRCGSGDHGKIRFSRARS